MWQLEEETLEQALAAAVVCCILAAAGPQRSRMLATLYKDERISRLPSFTFLEKVFFERILRKEEVCPSAEFGQVLCQLKIIALFNAALWVFTKVSNRTATCQQVTLQTDTHYMDSLGHLHTISLNHIYR